MHPLLTAIILLVSSLAFLYPSAGYGQATVENQLHKLAIEQIRSQCPTCDVQLETKWIPDELRSSAARVTLLRFEEVGLPRGYQTASVEYIRNGKAQTRQVQLYAEVKRKVPVVNKRIERNRTITPADVTWKRKDLSRMRKLPVLSLEEVTGKASAGIMQKGDAILPSDLQQIPVIAVGDNIRMIYQKDGVKLAMNCTARQAKARGERIRVYSDETRKTYIAKVLTPSKVIWKKTL